MQNQVLIDARNGVDIDTNDFTLTADGAAIGTNEGDITLDASGFVDIDATEGISLQTDDGDITIDAAADVDIDVDANGVDIFSAC